MQPTEPNQRKLVPTMRGQVCAQFPKPTHFLLQPQMTELPICRWEAFSRGDISLFWPKIIFFCRDCTLGLFFAANDGNGHFLQFLKVTSTGMFFLETSQCFQLRNPRGVASPRRRLKKVDFVEIEMSFSVKIQFWAVSGQLLILGIDEKSAKLTIVQCLHIHRDRLSVPLWADRIWTCHESCFCQLARVTAISKGFNPY